MAVTFDATANPGGVNGVTTASWSHTVAAGSNLALYVVAGGTPNSTSNLITSVTFGAASLSFVHRLIRATGTATGVEIWRLLNPTPSTATITVTWTTSNFMQGSCHSASFSGVHQTTPEGTPLSNEGSATSATVSPAGGASGDFAIDGLGMDNATPVMTAQTGRVQRVNVAAGPEAFAGSTMPSPANPQALAWTWTGSREFTVAGVVIKQSAAKAPPPFRRPYRFFRRRF